MIRNFYFLQKFFIIFFLLTAGDKWELKKDKDNIAVYTRKNINSDFKELKCVTTVKSSLSSIVKILTDYDHYPDWVYHCPTARLVKKINDKDLYYYYVIEAPWPVDDRDMAAHMKISQENKTKVVSVTADIADGIVPVNKDMVRVTQFHSVYTLTPKKNGMVEIDLEMGTEPGGNVPAWLINSVIVKGPFNTQLIMNRLLQSSTYKTARLSFITEP